MIVGTIHSVKGGQADSVYVVPDLSRNAYREKNNQYGGARCIVAVAVCGVYKSERKANQA